MRLSENRRICSPLKLDPNGGTAESRQVAGSDSVAYLEELGEWKSELTCAISGAYGQLGVPVLISQVEDQDLVLFSHKKLSFEQVLTMIMYCFKSEKLREKTLLASCPAKGSFRLFKSFRHFIHL